MKNKRLGSAAEAVADIFDGATLLIGGFGRGGVPETLIEAVCSRGLKNLTIVSNNSGTGHTGIARLVEQGCVGKMICSFPWAKESFIFKQAYEAGKVALEVVPQGTLAERIRNAGSGLGGFLTPTALGTELAAGKPVINVDGRDYVLEKPLPGDFALVRGHRVDRRGNLTYRMAGRNFNPVMATAAKVVIAEAAEEITDGFLDPEIVVTPSIYVDRYIVAQIASKYTGVPSE